MASQIYQAGLEVIVQDSTVEVHQAGLEYIVVGNTPGYLAGSAVEVLTVERSDVLIADIVVEVLVSTAEAIYIPITISASMVNDTLGKAQTTFFEADAPDVRSFAEVPNGEISFSDFYLKTYEVQANVAGGTNLKAQTYFDSQIWTSNVTKRFTVTDASLVGSISFSPALDTGTGWGGQLIIENYGSIQGKGGTPNGGAGGNALQVSSTANLVIINSGNIYGGGGAGGKGANGSNAVVSTVVREPASGDNFFYP